MRCDWPMGYDEECLEPACEIFLQLFLQNAQAAINDNPVDDDHDNEEIPFQEDVEEEVQVEEGQEMDDYFIQENDEDDDDDSQENDGNDSQEHDDYDADDSEEHEGSVTTITLSSDSDFSSETVFEPYHYEQPEHASSSSSDFSSETVFDSHQYPDEQPEHVSSSSSTNSVEPTDLELQDNVEFHGNLEPVGEKSNNDDHCNQNPLNEMSQFSEESWNFADVSCEESQLNEESDAFQDSDVSSSVYSHQSDNSNDVLCSNVGNKENSNLATIPLGDLPLSSEKPQPEGCGVETATTNNTSSTHVSLYVVVPPPSNSDNGLLSGASSDEKNSDVIPISPSSSSPASSSTVLTDTEIIHLDDAPTQNSCKIPNSFDESTSIIPDVSDESSCKGDDRKYLSLPEFHSASGIIATVKDAKSDVSGGFHGVHPEFSKSENSLFQEMDMIVESNASDEVMQTVTVPSLKRKVRSPVEDNIVNKVPKFSSSSDNSNESLQGPLDNSERSSFSEENIVPSSVTEGNIILSLGNSIEESSTMNEKQKKIMKC